MKTPKLKLFILFTTIFILSINSNASERDSLLNLLKQYKQEDTVRVNLLIETGWYYWYYGIKQYPFIKEAHSLSEKLDYKKGILISKFMLIKVLIESYGKLDTAKILLDDLQEISKSDNNEFGICLGHLCFLEYQLYAGEYNKVIDYYEKHLSKCINTKDQQILINSELWASAAYIKMGDTINAQKCLNIASRNIESLNNKTVKPYLLYLEVLVLMDYYKNDSYEAVYFKLLSFLREIDDKKAEANVIWGLDINRNMGKNYSKSLKSIYYVLELYKELNDSSGISGMNASLAWIHYSLKNYEKAKFYSLNVLKIQRMLINQRSIANSLVDLGFIYIQQDSLKKALDYLSESLELSIQINSDYFKTWNYIGLALIADKNKESDKAYEYYQKMMQYNYAVHAGVLGLGYAELANHYYLKQDYNKALYYADTAYIVSIKGNFIDMAIKAAEVLHKTYAIKGKTDLAYKYLLECYELNDSIKENEAIELGLIYDFEQKNSLKQIEQEKIDLINKQELRQQKNIRNIFISGSGVLLLLIIVVLRNYMQKQKANKLLEEQKFEIKAQNEELNHQNEEIHSINEALNVQKELVEKRNAELQAQNEEISSQRDLLSKHNKLINESILYAKRIQTAVLPPEAYINEILPENFILFKPRDKVSGDFYWIKQIGDFIVIAVADCTGHGVPGAIMSMLGISFLNEIVQKREITQTNQGLNDLRKQIKQALRQTGRKGEADDGMDIALCAINAKTNTLQFSGANIPIYLIQNGELIEIKADKMPIGYYPNEKPSFTNHEVQLKEGDIFYLFSDGYMDQFGGKKGFKYRAANFQKILLENHNKPMVIQKELLEEELKTWMKSYDQTDDILVMGVRV